MGKNHKSNSKPLILISLLLLAAAAALSAAARMVPGFAQRYSTTVYPVLVSSVGRLMGLADYSVAEILCVVLAVLVIADLIISVCRIRRSEGRSLRRAFARLFLLLCLLIFLYSANCNVNYYRDPFVPAEIYNSAAFTQEELEDFCGYILTELEASDASAVYPSGSGLTSAAIDAMNTLSAKYPPLKGFYPQPKQLTFISRFFSMMGVSGVYSPFTIEANINGEMPGMEKPFTACHELSHLRGYMIEGEANFIGWLACINSGDPAFERSGWLIGWNYAANSLRKADPEAFERLADRLPASASAELSENHIFWVTHENKASEVQDQLNDAYLKSNGQKDGIQSYGRLTTLMLLWYKGML